MSLVAWSTHDQMFSCTSRDARTVTYCKTARRYRSRRLSHGRRSKTARRSATGRLSHGRPRVGRRTITSFSYRHVTRTAKRRSATGHVASSHGHVLQSVVQLPVTSLVARSTHGHVRQTAHIFGRAAAVRRIFFVEKSECKNERQRRRVYVDRGVDHPRGGHHQLYLQPDVQSTECERRHSSHRTARTSSAAHLPPRTIPLTRTDRTTLCASPGTTSTTSRTSPSSDATGQRGRGVTRTPG